MTVTLGDAVLYLTAEDRDLDKGLKKADSKIKKFSSGASKMIGGIFKVGMIAAAAAIVGSVAIIGKSLFAASDAAEAATKFTATFGGASNSLRDSIDAVAEATGRSKYGLREMAGNVGAVAKAMGLSEKEAAGFTEALVTNAVDVAAFNNVSETEVIHAYTRALTGEFESLKQLGIVVNVAKLNQELYNMGIEGGTQAATEFEKASAITNIILRQTSDATGVAAEEAGSFAGQMVGLKASWSDFLTDLGTNFLPAVEPILRWFGERIPGAMDTLVTKIGGIMEPVQLFIDLLGYGYDPLTALKMALKSAVPEEFHERIDKAHDALKNIGDWITENKDEVNLGLASIAAIVMTTVVPAFAAWAIAAAPIALIALAILGIGATVTAMALIWKNDWGGIRTALEDVYVFIDGILQHMIITIENVGGAISDLISWFWKLLADAKEVWGKIQKYLKPLIGSSPSPLAVGIESASKALKVGLTPELKKFSAQVGGMGEMGSTTTDQRDYSRTTQVEQMVINNGRDEQGVMQLLRNMSRA